MRVGSKVRVKKNLVLGECYGNPDDFFEHCFCNENHLKYSNKILTVRLFNDHFMVSNEEKWLLFHHSMVDELDGIIEQLTNFIHNNFLKA